MDKERAYSGLPVLCGYTKDGQTPEEMIEDMARCIKEMGGVPVRYRSIPINYVDCEPTVYAEFEYMPAGTILTQ